MGEIISLSPEHKKPHYEPRHWTRTS